MTAKLWLCSGYWKEPKQSFTDMVICDGWWDGIEDAEDVRIFYYTDGDGVLNDHGEFVVESASEYTPDWWANKNAPIIKDAVGINIKDQSNWAKANEAFYEWEKHHYGDEESDYSDDDRMIWVEGYLQALRDAS